MVKGPQWRISSALICIGLAAAGALNIQAAEGDLDLTFSFDGKVITDVTTFQESTRGIAIDSHGRIVVAGDAFNGQAFLALARYNPDGSLDTTFGTGGKITSGGPALAVAVDRNDRILIGGYQSSGSDFDMAVTRYNEDGTLDLTFGTNGTAVTNYPGSQEFVTKIAVDSNDRIVATGVTTPPPANLRSPDTTLMAVWRRRARLARLELFASCGVGGVSGTISATG